MTSADPTEFAVRLAAWLTGRKANIHPEISTTQVRAKPYDRASAAYTIAESDIEAALAKLEQLQALLDEQAPVMPDPRGPLYQRLATDWHTVSAITHRSWTNDGYVWDHEHDIEHPDECNLLPYGQECLFDRVSTVLGLDDEELSFGPRRARAHVFGPDVNGEFEERIEWGNDAETPSQLSAQDSLCGAYSRPGLGGVLGPCTKPPGHGAEWHVDAGGAAWDPAGNKEASS